MRNVLDLPWKMQRHRPAIHTIDLSILLGAFCSVMYGFFSHSDEDRLVSHISACSFSLFRACPRPNDLRQLFSSRPPMYLWSFRSIFFFFVFWIMSSYNTLLSNSRLGDLLFFLPAFFRDPRPVPSVRHFVCKVCLLRVGTTACALHIFVRASLLCSLVWSEFRKAQFSIA